MNHGTMIAEFRLSRALAGKVGISFYAHGPHQAGRGKVYTCSYISERSCA